MTIHRNPFSLAIKAALGKKQSAKLYLTETEGKTEEEADAILEEVKNSIDSNKVNEGE